MIPSSLVFWVIICHHHYCHCTTLLILSSIAYQSLNVVLDEAAGLTNSALRKVCQTLVLNGHKIRLFIYGCIFLLYFPCHTHFLEFTMLSSCVDTPHFCNYIHVANYIMHAFFIITYGFSLKHYTALQLAT